MTDEALRPESVAAQALGWIDETTRAINPPIHVSSTYLRDADNGYSSGRVYMRADNPAFDQAEAVITELEHGHQTLLFASGMAAATAVFQALQPGDHVLAPKVMYWSLRNWLTGFATLVGTRRRADRHDRPRRGGGRAPTRRHEARLGRDAGEPALDHHRHRRDRRDRARGGRPARRRLDARRHRCSRSRSSSAPTS